MGIKPLIDKEQIGETGNRLLKLQRELNRQLRYKNDLLKEKIKEILKCQRCGVCMLHSNELKEMGE